MKIARKIRTGLAVLLILPAGWALLAQQDQNEAAKETTKPDIAVIVNPVNPAESITLTDLRKIFAGDKQSWSSSLPVFAMVRAPEARERDVLLGQVLRMTESEYKQHWVKKVYSGEAQREPLTVFSNGMQLEAVRVEKGGIALIASSDVRQGVKVLKVEGQLPGASGYPLK